MGLLTSYFRLHILRLRAFAVAPAKQPALQKNRHSKRPALQKTGGQAGKRAGRTGFTLQSPNISNLSAARARFKRGDLNHNLVVLKLDKVSQKYSQNERIFGNCLFRKVRNFALTSNINKL